MQTLSFPQPPSLNQIIDRARHNRYQSANLKKIWTAKIANLAGELTPISSPCWVAVEWDYISTLSDPDNALSGILKFGLDGLVKAGILKGDTVRHIVPPISFTYHRATDSTCKILLFSDYGEYKDYLLGIIAQNNPK
jgi:hypothetical protein